MVIGREKEHDTHSNENLQRRTPHEKRQAAQTPSQGAAQTVWVELRQLVVLQEPAGRVAFGASADWTSADIGGD